MMALPQKNSCQVLFHREVEKKKFRNEHITGTIEKSFEKIREKDVSLIFSSPNEYSSYPESFRDSFSV